MYLSFQNRSTHIFNICTFTVNYYIVPFNENDISCWLEEERKSRSSHGEVLYIIATIKYYCCPPCIETDATLDWKLKYYSALNQYYKTRFVYYHPSGLFCAPRSICRDVIRSNRMANTEHLGTLTDHLSRLVDLLHMSSC